LGRPEHFTPWRVTHPLYPIAACRPELDDFLGAVHVARAELEVLVPEDMLAEELVGSGARLTADAHDLVVGGAGNRDAELRPLGDGAAFGEDLRQLLERDLLHGVVLVDVNGERVVPDDEAHRVLARVALDLLGFLGLDVAAGVGDVDGAALEGGQADARTAARDLDVDGRGDGLVDLGPGLRDVHHRVRALDLSRLWALSPAAAGGEEERGELAQADGKKRLRL
jgi:hypothetical protein